MTDEAQLQDLRVREVTDADFEQVVLDHSEPPKVVVVLFHRADSEDSAQVAASLEQVAQAGYTVVKLDIDAGASRETAGRFVPGELPMLLLFRRGTLRSIFDWPTRTAGAVLRWIAFEAEDFQSLEVISVGEQVPGVWRPGMRLADASPSIRILDSAEFEQEVLGVDDPEAIAIVHFIARKEPVSVSAARVLEQVADNGWTVFNIDCEEKASGGSQTTAERFAFGTLPTLLLFKGGKLEACFNDNFDPVTIGQWASGVGG